MPNHNSLSSNRNGRKEAYDHARLDKEKKSRLTNLSNFVEQRRRPDRLDHDSVLWMDEEDIKRACCDGGVAEGLILSENLQMLSEELGNVSDATDLTKRLEDKELPDKLLSRWFLRFFSSLQLAEVATEIAVKSPAFSEANQHFNPSAFFSRKLDDSKTAFEQFWKEAVPELAKASLDALEARKGFASTNQCKFADELQLGDIDAFYLGLDGVIGLPKLKFLEEMKAEHASMETFKAYNQGRERVTSPHKEWQRVCSKGCITCEDEGDTPCGSCNLGFMEHELVEKAKLLQAEVFALRLYTSPMYVQYNNELRQLLSRYKAEQDRRGGALSTEKKLECLACARGTITAEGSKFVTTIHAIASGMIKLSKESGFRGKTYRGIRGKDLPACFLKPTEQGGRGGTEYGFMSTSQSKEQAMRYALPEHQACEAKGGAGMPIVLEIDTGMVDHGADLAWVSYFPGEKEILLPPLSNLELCGFPRYEEVPLEGQEEGLALGGGEQRGARLVMVLPIRVNLNLKQNTLDQLRERRKQLHMQTFENLIDEVEREFESDTKIRDMAQGSMDDRDVSELRQLVLEQCRSALQEHRDKDIDHFNDDDQYKQFLDEALVTKVRARRMFKVLLRSGDGKQLAKAKQTALAKFSSEKEYYPVKTGIEAQSFPWGEICDGKVLPRVVIEKEASDFLKPSEAVSPHNLRCILRCLSRHGKAVQSVAYGSFVLDQDASRLREGQQQSGGHEASASTSKHGERIAFGALTICRKKDGKGRKGETLGASVRGEHEGVRSAEYLPAEYVELSIKTVLSHDGALFIANVLRGCRALTGLNLANCKLFSAGSQQLAAGLKEVGSGLISLDLSNCALGLRGSEQIVDALMSLPGLTSLTLRQNVLSTTAWREAAKWMGMAGQLQRLDMAYCCLPPEAASEVAVGLQCLRGLQELNLEGSLSKDEAHTTTDCIAAVLCNLHLTFINGLHLPQGEAVWHAKELYDYGEVDGGLLESLVRHNTQLTELNNLKIPRPGEVWRLSRQVEAPQEASESGAICLLGKWKRRNLPLAFLHNVERSGISKTLRGLALDGVIFPRWEDLQTSIDVFFSQAAAEQTAELLRKELQQQEGVPQDEAKRELLMEGLKQNNIEGMWLLGFDMGQFAPSDQKQLFKAALKGGVEVCMAMVECTPLECLAKQALEDGRTCLMRAARYGVEPVVHSLLLKGCKLNPKDYVNAKDSEGQTALMMASGRGFDSVVELLLEHGAEVDAYTPEGWSAVHYAARYAANVIALLDKVDASIMERGTLNKGLQPLHLAAANKNRRLVCKLLEKKASPDCLTTSKKTPLILAASKGDEHVVELLLKQKADVGSVDERGVTALMEAAQNGRVELVQLLLQHGAKCKPNHANNDGYTALMLALRGSKDPDNAAKVVQALLGAPKPSAPDKSGPARKYTELGIAASNGLHTVVKLLVEAGFGIDQADGSGKTALMHAALNNHGQTVDALLREGAKVNEHTPGSQWTALMLSADRGYTGIVKALLKERADKTWKGKDGKTALDLAQRKGHENVVHFLSDHGGEGGEKEEVKPYDSGSWMRILPMEVPAHMYEGFLHPRDDYDLMQPRRHSVWFKLDTRVFKELESFAGVDIKWRTSSIGTSVPVLSSPLSAVTLRGEERASANIPYDACYFSFFYPTKLPIEVDGLLRKGGKDSIFLLFLTSGGYVYWNKSFRMIHINAITVSATPRERDDRKGFTLDSSSDLDMQPASVELLERWNRWQDVTIPFLKQKGFLQFAWIGPSEVLCDKYINPFGGFAYRKGTPGEKATFYPICGGGDEDRVDAPEYPFTTKIEGSSDEGETSEDVGDKARALSLKRVSSRKEVASLASNKRTGLGVTGLLEVRKEVMDILRHHLLNHAKRLREEDKGQQRLQHTPRAGDALSSLLPAPRDAAQKVSEGEQFDISKPMTWKSQDLPAFNDKDSPAQREQKLLRLIDIHAECPENLRLRLPVPMNLLALKHFGKTPLREYLRAEDTLRLTRSRRQRVVLKLDRRALECVPPRTKEWVEASAAVQELQTQTESFKLAGSPLYQVTLPEDVQVRAGIPQIATFYCFCYPLINERQSRTPALGREKSTSKTANRRRPPTDALGCFLRLGGFIYFDDRYAVLSISALSVSAADNQGSRSVLHLGPSLPLPRTAVRPLEKAKRWWPVANRAAEELGYTHFAWIRPCEVLADHIFCCMQGGFAYRGPGDNASYFPVLQSIFDVDYGDERQYKAKYEPKSFGIQVDGHDGAVTALSTRFVAPRTIELDGHDAISSRFGATSTRVSDPIVTDSDRRRQRFEGSGESLCDIGELRSEIERARELFGNSPCADRMVACVSEEEISPFVSKPEARLAQLSETEIAALRVFTCPAFATLLHQDQGQHAFRLTYQLVCQGVDKLQALFEDCLLMQHRLLSETEGADSVMDTDNPREQESEFHTSYLWAWKGLEAEHQRAVGATAEQDEDATVSARTLGRFAGQPIDVGVPQSRETSREPRADGARENPSWLMEKLAGGLVATECFACTKDIDVVTRAVGSDGIVAGLSADHHPILLRIKVSSPGQIGADLSWLSVDPHEQEMVYPAGTRFKPIFAQQLRLTSKSSRIAFVLTLLPQKP